MTMKLVKFRVTNFRSAIDSTWVDANGLTALIGVNESGKTNLLLPLWKLNPAKDGAIDVLSDYPRKDFNVFRKLKPQPVFIEAVFEAGPELIGKLVKASGLPPSVFTEVRLARRFDGTVEVDFPDAQPIRTTDAKSVHDLLKTAATEIQLIEGDETEASLRATITAAVTAAGGKVSKRGTATAETVEEICADLAAVDISAAAKTSVLAGRFKKLAKDFSELVTALTRAHPRDDEEIRKLVVDALPEFVYYSNYGNLDSDIYLPHVIQNLTRTDLGSKEQAKARTLKVLFEFVGLQPQEILELGRDFKDPAHPARQPTPAEIEVIANKKRQRSILLQSAGTQLTRKFREWWRQGDYRFRFEADGDHFRIWVSDDRRPEDVELENRSTGLQWFLSFYLVFLVESSDSHENAILLLDEPGMSLHPLAQRDLSAFFAGLADTNQIIYTTHSPFLVDSDHLDRVRKVYVSDDGTTKVTPDLGAVVGDSTQKGSGYAVHAALGLSVAESLLIGCLPVLVEGPSDQHYLSAIKTLLIGMGKLSAGRELIFPPCGGARGVKPVVALLGSRDDDLPVVLFDSDENGKQMATNLRSGLYSDDRSRVLEVGTFAPLKNAEIEDLMPGDFLAAEVDRWQRGADVAFADGYRTSEAIVPQIEAWASTQGIKLALGWKVELAKRVKQSLLLRSAPAIPEPTVAIWKALFDAFVPKQAVKVKAKANS